MKQGPSFDEEERLWRWGYKLIAGIDEAGRGPLAGPVVAAAVILPSRHQAPWLSEVRDSKKLSPKKRETLAELIRNEAIAVSFGIAQPEVIDASGIVGATRFAMSQAVNNLPRPPSFLLVDALSLPEPGFPDKSIIRGDDFSLSIACASILAKVYRDKLMIRLDAFYPGYGFARNKGYATSEHLTALKKLGASPIHRKRFSPVAKVLRSSA